MQTGIISFSEKQITLENYTIRATQTARYKVSTHRPIILYSLLEDDADTIYNNIVPKIVEMQFKEMYRKNILEVNNKKCILLEKIHHGLPRNLYTFDICLLPNDGERIENVIGAFADNHPLSAKLHTLIIDIWEIDLPYDDLYELIPDTLLLEARS
jgi:hypothetical protein